MIPLHPPEVVPRHRLRRNVVSDGMPFENSQAFRRLVGVFVAEARTPRLGRLRVRRDAVPERSGGTRVRSAADWSSFGAQGRLPRGGPGPLVGSGLHPGRRCERRHRPSRRAPGRSSERGTGFDGRVGLVDAGQHGPAQQAVVLVEPPGQGVFGLGGLGRTRPLAISASTSGSRWPAMRASIISRPDFVSTDDATDDSLTPASSQDLVQPLGLPAPLLDHRLR